jgi:hypothetical protein
MRWVLVLYERGTRASAPVTDRPRMTKDTLSHLTLCASAAGRAGGAADPSSCNPAGPAALAPRQLQARVRWQARRLTGLAGWGGPDRCCLAAACPPRHSENGSARSDSPIDNTQS